MSRKKMVKENLVLIVFILAIIQSIGCITSKMLSVLMEHRLESTKLVNRSTITFLPKEKNLLVKTRVCVSALMFLPKEKNLLVKMRVCVSALMFLPKEKNLLVKTRVCVSALMFLPKCTNVEILYVCYDGFIVNDPNKCDRDTEIKVERVIDGDTFELENGAIVRLLGINSPEKGQPYYQEATNRLKDLVEGNRVTLISDVDDKDQYGRLLRYVFFNDTFINLLMVKEGLANVYIIEPNHLYEGELYAAQLESMAESLGIWQRSEDLTCGSNCIGIAYFHWNAKGNDCDNLNDEFVKLKNTCSYPVI
jgi:endonuclease YncB( thermonuclease family)